MQAMCDPETSLKVAVSDAVMSSRREACQGREQLRMWDQVVQVIR